MNTPETLYECLAVLESIESNVDENGEIPDEAMQAIVVAQTTSMEKLSSLVGYLKYLEAWQATCKAEEDRIYKRRKTAENRLSSIKNFLTPYIQEVGKKTVGTHTLSLRKSQAVILDDDFDNHEYGEDVTTFKPDKKKIKEELKARPDLVIEGAELVDRLNLQIR